MRKASLSPILLLLFFLATPVLAKAVPRHGGREKMPARVDVARLEQKIHTLINLERKRAGLPALAWNQALQGIARRHSQGMAAQGFFSHTDPQGRSFSERYQQAGFDCVLRTSASSTCLGGENIAQNGLYSSISWRNVSQRTNWNSEEQIASAVVRQWMASPGHRRNILTSYYRREGIGVAIDQQGRVLVTQDFC